MSKPKNELTKEEKLECKKLRNDVKTDLKLLKKVNVPELQIAHLERIIRFYNRIFEIETPSISDRATLKLIKMQYQGMCAIRSIRVDKSIL